VVVWICAHGDLAHNKEYSAKKTWIADEDLILCSTLPGFPTRITAQSELVAYQMEGSTWEFKRLQPIRVKGSPEFLMDEDPEFLVTKPITPFLIKLLNFPSESVLVESVSTDPERKNTRGRYFAVQKILKDVFHESQVRYQNDISHRKHDVTHPVNDVKITLQFTTDRDTPRTCKILKITGGGDETLQYAYCGANSERDGFSFLNVDENYNARDVNKGIVDDYIERELAINFKQFEQRSFKDNPSDVEPLQGIWLSDIMNDLRRSIKRQFTVVLYVCLSSSNVKRHRELYNLPKVIVETQHLIGEGIQENAWGSLMKRTFGQTPMSGVQFKNFLKERILEEVTTLMFFDRYILSKGHLTESNKTASIDYWDIFQNEFWEANATGPYYIVGGGSKYTKKNDGVERQIRTYKKMHPKLRHWSQRALTSTGYESTTRISV
jgi:hypothetical protein